MNTKYTTATANVGIASSNLCLLDPQQLAWVSGGDGVVFFFVPPAPVMPKD